MNYYLNLHDCVQFEYEPRTNSPQFPAWMIRLLAGNNIEYNMQTNRWYWQRTTVINDGDYIVRVHPKMVELGKIVAGVDPRKEQQADAEMNQFLSALGQLGKSMTKDEWSDGFNYGVMSGDPAVIESLISKDASLGWQIDALIEAAYAQMDSKEASKQ